jgi:hypothetical protein
LAVTRPGDPLGGDTNAHTIARKLRKGHPPRKIAKHMGLPLSKVKAVQKILKKP